jgi:DNA polymerase-3 subunit alpha
VDARALNKRVLEHLVKTGAFDFSGAPRKQIFDGIDAALAGAASAARDKAAGQHSFMDMMVEEPPAKYSAGTTGGNPRAQVSNLNSASGAPADFAPTERLAFEKELLGFYVSGHPLNAYAGLAEAVDTFTVDELLRQTERVEFRLCGIVSGIAKKLSKKDNRPWAAFTLATKKASLPLNMFADAYAADGARLAENALVLVQGNILAGNDGPRINVKECHPLDTALPGLVRRVIWLLRPAHPEVPAFLRRLRDIVNQQPGDTRLDFGFLFEDRVAPIAEASAALGWKISPAAFQELHTHPAVAGVQLETKPLALRPEQRRWGRKN